MTPDALVGTWRLRRRLVDRTAGLTGRVDGTLDLVSAGDGLEWREAGTLVTPGWTVPVTRRYLVLEGDTGWWLHFDDGRPFHPWTPGVAVEHPCRADLYRGLVRVDSPRRWRTLWDVSGPAKDQRIVTRLDR